MSLGEDGTVYVGSRNSAGGRIYALLNPDNEAKATEVVEIDKPFKTVVFRDFIEKISNPRRFSFIVCTTDFRKVDRLIELEAGSNRSFKDFLVRLPSVPFIMVVPKVVPIQADQVDVGCTRVVIIEIFLFRSFIPENIGRKHPLNIISPHFLKEIVSPTPRDDKRLWLGTPRKPVTIHLKSEP